MTSEDALTFGKALYELGVATKRKVTDSVIAVYWKHLQDVPVGTLVGAMEDLARYGRKGFPSPGLIRQRAEQRRVNPDRGLPPVPTHPDDPPHCDRCEDTGWEVGLWCEGGSCGHRRVHVAHRFTRPCACRPTNPVYRERCKKESLHHAID